jgi:formyl-CoA transferase
MPEVTPRLSATPGRIRWTGRPKGSANADVYGRLLGLGEEDLESLTAEGII